MKTLPFGESALLLDLELENAGDRARRTLSIAQALRASFPGADIVPAAGTIALLNIDEKAGGNILCIATQLLSEASPPPLEGQFHTIHAVYDGPDLEDMAQSLHLQREEIIELHTGRELMAELLGFLPGFAYLGPIDKRLIMARKPSPRPRVAAGSIAVAGCFTGIYPLNSPGGWNLIGRSIDTILFDPTREPPILLKAGDRIRFVRIPKEDAPPPQKSPPEALPESIGQRGIEIIGAPPCTTVQDIGRIGCLHLGFPPSGPQDFVYFQKANLAVGNHPNEAALEIPLGTLRLRALGPICISLDGNTAQMLYEGEEWSFEANERAVRYLAIEGGFSVSDRLGSKATLLGAHFGGFGGRMLKRGDRLYASETRLSADRNGPLYSDMDELGQDPIVLEASPGPHQHRFPHQAMQIFLSGEFSVSTLSNRVGTRLEGLKIPRDGPDLALPAPMRRGAVQITSDGTPIVLGPDHPVTGGYPLLAMLSARSQAVLSRLKPGSKVRFRPC